MTKFIVVTGLLLALVVILNLSVRWFAAQPDVPEEVQFWHMQDCTVPCILGISPGHVSLQQAQGILLHKYPTPDYELTNIDNDVPDIGYIELVRHHTSINPQNQTRITLFASESGVVRGVNLLGTSLDGFMPSLGTVVTTFGPPTCVVPLQLRGTQRFLTLHYNNAQDLTYLSITLDSTRLDWLQAVYALTLLSPSDRSRPCQIYGHGSLWRGLLSYERYIFAPAYEK